MAQAQGMVCAQRAIFIWKQKGKSIEPRNEPTWADFERHAAYRQTAFGQPGGRASELGQVAR
jgi:hypothetical protein